MTEVIDTVQRRNGCFQSERAIISEKQWSALTGSKGEILVRAFLLFDRRIGIVWAMNTVWGWQHWMSTFSNTVFIVIGHDRGSTLDGYGFNIIM